MTNGELDKLKEVKWLLPSMTGYRIPFFQESVSRSWKDESIGWLCLVEVWAWSSFSASDTAGSPTITAYGVRTVYNLLQLNLKVVFIWMRPKPE